MSGSAPRIDGLTFVRNLGRGGYADVYLYRQSEPDRDVAVKVIRDVSMSDVVRRRFRAEANAMARVQNHRNIASVFTVGTTSDQRPYLVMQYYPGGSLADGKLRSVREVLQIGIHIGSALETAHRKGLHHRDIKPHNILYDSEWNSFVLADFGIAGQAADDGDVGVSIPWSAPEVLYDKAPAGVRSDVYSLAATLWTLLAGRSPFEAPGGDNGDTALMNRIGTLAPPSVGRPDVPVSLDRLLMQAMAKDPDHRPQSAMDFIRWLQRIEQELHLAPTPIEVSESSAVDPATPIGRTPPQPPSPRPLPAGNMTKLRGPSALTPEPAGPSRATEWGAKSPPTAETHVPSRRPAPASATTVRPSASVVETQQTDQLPPPKRNRGLVVVAIAALIVVATIVVIALNLTGGAKPTAASTGEASETSRIDDPAPWWPVVVTGERIDAKTVEFHWTYPAKAGDTFVYKIGKNGTARKADKPTAQVSQAAGKTCIWVKVTRQDSSFFWPDWRNAGTGCAE